MPKISSTSGPALGQLNDQDFTSKSSKNNRIGKDGTGLRIEKTNGPALGQLNDQNFASKSSKNSRIGKDGSGIRVEKTKPPQESPLGGGVDISSGKKRGGHIPSN
ncbi:MAG: hypothetical protein AB1489_02110, partial [Acidobacteriota bacterium]